MATAALRGIGISAATSLLALAALLSRNPRGIIGLGILYAVILCLLWVRDARPFATGMAMGMAVTVLGVVASLLGLALGGGVLLVGADTSVVLASVKAIVRDPELRAFGVLGVLQVALAGSGLRAVGSFPRGERTWLGLALGFVFSLAAVSTVLLTTGAVTWSTS